MSEGPINGDHAPSNLTLKRAFGVLKQEVRRISRRVRRGKIILPDGVVMVKLARSFCIGCTRMWDFAMLPEGSLPKPGICSDCKKKLAEGYCIFTCGTETPIFVKPMENKEQWPVGKISRIGKGDYDALVQKFTSEKMERERIQKRKDKANKPDFDLAGLKVGNSFYGCEKCLWRSDPGVVMNTQCPNCRDGRTKMRHYTVTEFDVIPKDDDVS